MSEKLLGCGATFLAWCFRKSKFLSVLNLKSEMCCESGLKSVKSAWKSVRNVYKVEIARNLQLQRCVQACLQEKLQVLLQEKQLVKAGEAEKVTKSITFLQKVTKKINLLLFFE